MALEESNGSGMVMPVTPFGGNGFGNSGWGDGSFWIILLFIILGGWGNGFGGYGNGGGVGFVDSSVQRGFDQASIMNGLTGISNNVVSGFGDVQTALCAGFNGVEIGANARQMANMQSMFDLQSQLASCCCENRLATADLKYTIASEECSTRANNTANTQAILDKLCQLELDGVKAQIEAKNDRIAELQTQLNMANLAASQTAQTGKILADNAAQTVALEQYLNPVPVPAYIVQNPNCCAQNTGCGCGF